MTNLADVLNGSKVALYAETTLNNYTFIGGQVSHSTSLTKELIDTSSKSLPNARCNMAGEGRLLSDVSGEILFSSDAAYQFLFAQYEAGNIFNILEKKDTAPLDPSLKIPVMISAFTESVEQNTSLKSSVSFVSSDSFSSVPQPAIIAGTFESTSFSATSEDMTPWGVAKVGTDFWVAGDTNDSIFIYDSVGAYSAVTHDVSAQTLAPRGITMDNVNVWVAGSDNDAIYAYTTAGANIPAQTIDVSNEGTAPLGVAWNGYHLFVTFTGSTIVYKYTAAGVYTGVSFDTALNTAITAITGIEFDGKFFWVCSDGDDKIYQFDKNGVTTGFDFSVSGEDTTPLGLTSNGVNLFMLGAAGSIYTYE